MIPQVLLLLAGAGSRFRNAGFSVSKALIPINGRPMFAHALAGLEDLMPYDLLVVVRDEQVRTERIDEAVRTVRSDAVVVELPGLTRGAAESALAGAPRLAADRPLIVLDCDLTFASLAYLDLVQRISGSDFDAAVLTFEATDPRYSFVELDAEGDVVAIVEKQAISTDAVAGSYLFRTAEIFLMAAQDVVTAGLTEDQPEFYLSTVIQSVLRRGGRVRAARVDRYTSFGTPEELVRADELHA